MKATLTVVFEPIDPLMGLSCGKPFLTQTKAHPGPHFYLAFIKLGLDKKLFELCETVARLE